MFLNMLDDDEKRAFVLLAERLIEADGEMTVPVTASDDAADLGLLADKKVAVLGYGSQGHAHALNLLKGGIVYANFVTTDGRVLDTTQGGVVLQEVEPDPNDQDMDGLLDKWEIEHFDSIERTDAEDDSDGDGFTNGQEQDLGLSCRLVLSQLPAKLIAVHTGHHSTVRRGAQTAMLHHRIPTPDRSPTEEAAPHPYRHRAKPLDPEPSSRHCVPTLRGCPRQRLRGRGR